MKKYMILTLCAGMIFSAASLTGCNESAQTAKTALQSSVVSTVSATEEETEATKPTEAATADEKAVIKEKGLRVDKDGNVVDSNGKTLETTKDGTVKVQTDDGSVVEISTATIKKETSAAAGSTGSAADNKTSSAQIKTENKSNSTTSKPAASSSGSSKVNNTSSSTTSKPANQNSNTSSKPAAGSASSGNTSSTTKKWHEAQYEYIQHPAETKQVWIVDQKAYTYERPVYEEVERAICNNCGADITDCLDEHMIEHALNGTGKYGYRGEWVEMQVGTETVTVPEKGHWETQVVKEAWTEKKLIREAGYY